MDHETQPYAPDAPTSKRRRSPIERLVTWSLIAIMIVVVGIEAQSRFGHEKTVTQLRKDLEAADQGGQELALPAAEQKINGWTFKTDNRVQGKGRLTYRWPSLFKTHVVQLNVGIDGAILSLDTDADALAGEKPAAPAQPAAVPPPGAVNAPRTNAPVPPPIQRPAKGFAAPLKGIVAVTTQDVDPRNMAIENDAAKLKVVRGILVRELIRQAFLLSAQEELQQTVRDQSLGDDVGSEDNPQAFPYELHAEILPTGMLRFRIDKPIADQPTYRRMLEPFQLDLDRFYESVLEHMEELSRSKFPEILRETKMTGEPNTFRESGDIPPNIETLLYRIDEVSQLTAIRALHALIHRDGESPERLAALSRAYANLGSLTEVHWQAHHKVFKARALLYAQRLVAATKSSPWSIAHRGYAWALTGRLQSASDDFAEAYGAQPEGEKLPRWIDDARAYCEYRPDQFESAEGKDKALASYLHLLAADPKDARTEFLTITQALVTESPGCARAQLAMCDVPELGIQRMMAEQGLSISWLGIYQTLQGVSGLPEDAVALIKRHAGAQQPSRDEPEDRVELIRLLKGATESSPGPNLSVYGLLLNEISFLHAVFRAKTIPAMLGMWPDDFIPEVAPTITGHPYAGYILSSVLNDQTAKAEFAKLKQNVKSTELDFNAQGLVYASNQRADSYTYTTFWMQALRHQDLIPRDLIQELQYDPQSQRYNLLVHFLNVVAPHLPQVVAQRINAEGLSNAEEAARLEKRYDGSPRVLQAIADWHSSRAAYADARRCLERRITIAPEVNAYQSLANVYAWSNDRAKWKDTLEEALNVPSLGLDHARIQETLALYHMHRNELNVARPYAEAAAQTYSAWGLLCAARCNERLGKMDQAEALAKACSERYETLDWFFWCRRTGRGDEQSARRLAEKKLEINRQSASEPYTELAIYYLIENDSAAALAAFENMYSARGNSYNGLHAALIVDAQGDAGRRDKLLQRIRENWNHDWVNAELADLMTAFLQQPDDAQWNGEAFRHLLYKCGDGEITNLYYFAGQFLDLRGRKDQARQYLQWAASSPRFDKFCCLLAAVELRARDEEIPACRPFEFGGDLSDLTPVKDELSDCWNARQYDRIVEVITQTVAGHPEWSFLLTDRGRANEQLGKPGEAIADYELAIERNADFQSAHHELAMVRGACEDQAFRDPAQALVHAQRAFDLAITPQYVNYTCLAIAFAANGNFDKAVELQKKAIDLWPADSKQEAEDRLKLFQEQKPYVRQPRNS